MTVSTSSLPTKLPNPDGLRSAAREIRAAGTTMKSDYTSAQNSWSALADGRYQAPEAAQAHNALETTVSPYVQAFALCSDGAATALETFATDIEAAKPLIEEARRAANEHNNVDVSDAVPPDYNSQMVEAAGKVTAAQQAYDEAVNQCVNSLQAVNPTISIPGVVGGTKAVQDILTDVIKYAAPGFNLGDPNQPFAGARFVMHNGRLAFSFDTDRMSDAQRANARQFRTGDFSSWFLRRMGLPDDYVNSLAPDTGNVSRSSTMRALDNLGPATLFSAGWLGRVPGAAGLAGKLDAKATAAMDRLAALMRRDQGFLRLSGNRTEFRLPLGDRATNAANRAAQFATNHPRTTRFTTGLGDVLDKAQGSKWLKGLGLAGTALSAADTYSDAYNDSLLRDPGASTQTHVREAATDTVVKETSSAVGGTVGTAVGRTAGAVVGQALIPIPGVGAAVGGFVGGLVGGAVGSAIGGGIGDAINSWRHTDGNVAEKAGAALGSFVNSINPFK